jgi:mannose-6-phosphate isomerase-like protein (cupin superfamily)
MHYHEHSRQFFYVLRGTPTLIVEQNTLLLREHEGLEVLPTFRISFGTILRRSWS